MSFRANGVAAGRRRRCRRDSLAEVLVAEREVAGRLVAAELRLEQRLLDGADLLALPAARVETARRRRVGRAGHVAAEDLALAPRAGARDRDRREQRAGVGVAR